MARARYDDLHCGEWRKKKKKGVTGAQPCLACGGPYDSWAHVLLGCKCPGVSGAIITRHNGALRALGRGVNLGRQARWLRLINAGRVEGNPDQATIPDWMMPGEREKPDMVILRGWPVTAGVPSGVVREFEGTPVQLHMVEFTCTSEARLDDRLQAKRAKYRPLRDRLRVEGRAVSEEVTAVAIGVRGGVNVDTAGWLGELGIEREADADKIIKDMVREVLWGNTRVVKAKWLAERAAGRAQQDGTRRGRRSLPLPHPGGGEGGAGPVGGDLVPSRIV